MEAGISPGTIVIMMVMEVKVVKMTKVMKVVKVVKVEAGTSPDGHDWDLIIKGDGDCGGGYGVWT